MHHLIFGHSFAELVALILLLGLPLYFLNKKKASVRGNPGDADTGGSGSSAAPTGINSDGSTPSPTETNSGSSSSSTATTGNSYDIFLSFRGKDTRYGFADHLYHRLLFAKIHPFRDDEDLRQGEKIGPDLAAAIKNSKILIPILSENYGTSSWCLDELVQIMECKKNKPETIVLPIFYKVAPAEVRHQIGNFGKAFGGYKSKTRLPERNFDPTILKKWEDALKEVGDLRGREVNGNGSEAALINLVVEQVLHELKKIFELDIPENLVGIDSHVQELMEVVNNNSGATLFFVIHGMGGIGKTTLAKKIYNELSHRFKYCCFIPDVRESCKQNRIEHLQKMLISVTLERDEKVSTRDEGINILSSRIKDKKVLILLDDVDNDRDLNALARNRSWFSSGSIIIITTRDQTIINKARGDYPYELEGMDMKNSTILFSRHAFLTDSPPSEFTELTNEVVSTTGGLPLALQVLGSFLCGAERKTWTNTIKKLKKIPAEEVQKKLKISYDALSHEQQQIFLDIACFFIGTDERIASYAWDAWEFFAEGIKVLRCRSLIKVGYDHELIMHDQLRDLGRYIIREGNENTPQNRSRLWDSEEAWKVLKENEGTSKIEAISLGEDSSKYRGVATHQGDIILTGEQFKKLTNLRFLGVRGAYFSGDFKNSTKKLKWLRWQNCPSNFDANNFHAKELVVLDLSMSYDLSDKWRGWSSIKMATELKVLDLRDCESLRRTPDLSAFKSLEILNLARCSDLEEIHPSIGEIKTLVSLDITDCWELKHLPTWADRMEELREPLLTRVRVREIQPMPVAQLPVASLTYLNLSHFHELAEIPDSIGSLVSLQNLTLNSMAIVELPESIGFLKDLETLDASDCESLACIPSSIGGLASLKRLVLAGCRSLREIPASIGKLTSLTKLDLNCTAIVELPESIGFLKDLETLNVSDCESLACIPSFIGGLASLKLLVLAGCHSLREIPASIGKLTSLTELDLNSTAIVELPESIGNMQNLRKLDISRTPAIKLIADSGIIAELEESIAAGWKNLEGLPGVRDELVSLIKLDLHKKQSELRIITPVHLKRPRIPPTNNSAMNYRTADSEHVLKRSRPFGISDEVNNLPENIPPVIFNSQSPGQTSYSSDDLPENVVMTLNQGSPVKSMDFHPVQQILLLVGTNMGDLMVWEVGSRARIALRNFKVWDLAACSTTLQASLANDYTATVNRVTWSSYGTLFGVAYSKHMVHIYLYLGGDDIRNHLEIEAHVGSVNDLAFSYPNKQLCVVTCGEDRSIKVWDAVTGAKQHRFEGHEAPVYSICPCDKENIQFIFSTATDGKIKAWLYNNMGSRVDCDAPGHSSTRMVYSADGTRLFSCGTNTEGESYLVEWNESEGAVKRTYDGLGERSGGVVQFDTTKNRFLAAGDEFMVKFWDMENNNILTSTDAEGGLPASPCIRFNKEGILLAVSTSDNSIKILANADGIRLLRTVENRAF